MITISKINQMLDVCKSQLDSIGIKYGEIDKVIINTRSKKTFAVCHYHGKTDKFSIEVMEFGCNLRTDEEIQNTIMHELLHTVKNCFNHGAMWKAVAEIVNHKFGYKVSRTGSFSKEALEKVNEIYKWSIFCECCNKNLANYHRKPKDKKNAYHSSCGIQSKGKLKLVQNK